MRVLLVFLMGCSLAEGRLVSKSELRGELMKEMKRQKELVDENILAKIVCNVELTTGFNTSAVNQRTPGNGEQVWTLYGLFQFGNRLACRDNTTSSPNVCQEECNSFVDDNIGDDIKCLLKIFSMLSEKGFNVDHFEEFKTMIFLILQEECRYKKNSEYFTD